MFAWVFVRGFAQNLCWCLFRLCVLVLCLEAITGYLCVVIPEASITEEDLKLEREAHELEVRLSLTP